MKALDAIGVYVHFPYCSLRCPYCDFKVDIHKDIPHAGYAGAVLRELEGRVDPVTAAQRELHSVYLGGGTPSLWQIEQVGAVIAAIASSFARRRAQLEVTLEANPSEVSAALLAGFRAAGVNRLSLGVQSFDDHRLKFLGRDHDAATARRALELALEAGFDSVSADLIFALPAQTLDEWSLELTTLASVGVPQHISLYELTVHEGTVFGQRHRKGTLGAVDEDTAVAMWHLSEERLAALGFSHYEVSNYARRGFQAVHNGLYWTGADYLGVGVSAHSLRVLSDRVERRQNQRHTPSYLREPLAEPHLMDVLTPSQHLRERVFLGLRTRAGVDLEALAQQLGEPIPHDVDQALSRLAGLGWVVLDGPHVRPTAEGLRFADALGEAVL